MHPVDPADTLVPAHSAHVDTFARDHLPPPEQWPELLFDLPGLRYPDRLNCAAELLAGTDPGRPAFHTPSGPPWTYGHLRDRVDRIAHVLTGQLGVVPGNRVLLRGPTTPWLAACWLAVLKAGAVAVTVLAQQRPHELRTICGIARVTHALCDLRSVDDLARRASPACGSRRTAVTRRTTCCCASPALPTGPSNRRTRPPTTWR